MIRGEEEPLLEMIDIHKSFNTVEVLKGVDFSLRRGEIVGLLGENGAGKSTLIKILSGVHPMNSGKIRFCGSDAHINSPEKGQELGISTIYQELSLFPTMTIAENIFMHREINKVGGRSIVGALDRAEMIKQSEHLLHEILDIDLDVRQRISDITLAQRQFVEISRALSTDAKIIIMDEPTTALENKEKNQLFEIMHTLADKGCAVIFISHHLDEMFQVCNRVVVLRDGLKAMDKSIKELSIEKVIAAMIGKTLAEQYPKRTLQLGKSIYSVNGMSGPGFQDVSFDVREKEIIGIIGLANCGKTELIRTLFGARTAQSGTVTLKNKQIVIRKVEDAIRNKIAFLPSERKVEGIFAGCSVTWNTSIAAINNFIHMSKINKKNERAATDRYINELNIKLSSKDQPINSLSGGNQQKVMLGRWFLTEPTVLLLEEPTRGIDVNAKTEVYRLITDFVDRGCCAVMVSSEEEEVFEMCDRIIIMRKGKIVTILDSNDTALEKIKYYSRFGTGGNTNESEIG